MPAYSKIRRGVPACAALCAASLLASSALAASAPLPSQRSSFQKTLALMPLASHRAIYKLRLLKSEGSKSPTFARGMIAFEFTGSPCDGYTQTLRQLTELQPGEGATRISDMRSATFEDAAGKRFAFKMETRIDANPTNEVDGHAQRAPGGAISVDLLKPKRKKFVLAPDILFPTEHLKYILAAAEAGKHVLEERVYDGSDTGMKIYLTTTYIGAPTTRPVKEPAVNIPLLKGMRRWPVTITYFDNSRRDELPNYILSFDLYQNGISRALRLDYGNFVLSGKMTSLKLVPTPACTK